MDYKIRFATPDDQDLVYGLKAESVRPYVEKIWGWDENYQKKDFDGDFSRIQYDSRIKEIIGSLSSKRTKYYETNM